MTTRHSPNPERAPSPLNANYFTTLPPSPERYDHTGQQARSHAQASYPTPPGSAPSSSIYSTRNDSALPANGEVNVRQNAHPASLHSPALNSGSSSPQLLNAQPDSTSQLRKRPSLLFTTAPTDISIPPLDAGASPLPSPRMRRHYPEHSPIDMSPNGSPSLAPTSSYLMPVSTSPNLSATPMERQPSSPRLGAFTDELGRLAQTMVRKASSTSLRGKEVDLPLSSSSSPALSSSGSPLLGSVPVRRVSYANQAREKEAREKEREKENELRQRKQKAEKFHGRMFSWAERPGDVIVRHKSKREGGLTPTRLAVYTVLFLGACTLLYSLVGFVNFLTGSESPDHFSTHDTVVHSDRHPSLAKRQRLIPRTDPEHGSLFIHPDVVNRPADSDSFGSSGGSWQWAKSIVFGPPTPPIFRDGYHPQVLKAAAISQTIAEEASASPLASGHDQKKHNVFVPNQHVPYSAHHALPPPPVHSDAPERDTLVLYRILGNDLPPRHTPGQTLRNLRFMLSHESDFSSLPQLGPHVHHHSHVYGSGSNPYANKLEIGGLRVDKYFVLNRIADPHTVTDILTLLKSYSVPNSRILIIPFEWAEYERQDFRWDGGVDDLAGWGIGPLRSESYENSAHAIKDMFASSEAPAKGTLTEKKRKAEVLARLRALDFTYHEKNLYAMNNNGGRNFALKHGRSLPNARWILPLDGNSFFTPAAMYSIVKTLSIAGEGDSASRYLIIPMARLLDNDAVLTNNSISLVPKHVLHEHLDLAPEEEADHHHRPKAAPDTPEEPQIGFRYDSSEDYQEAMRYGRRSKLELLWRLGAIPYSRGLDKRTMPWESTDREHVTMDTWGTIPGVGGLDPDADVFQSHKHTHAQPKEGWVQEDPERGPLAFCKAGWVYRLFSGDQNQELHSPEAIALRNTNRIKGIVSFIETLDERIARGLSECGNMNGDCGFSPNHLWNFHTDDLELLRLAYKRRGHNAVDRVDVYESAMYHVQHDASALFTSSADFTQVDPSELATNASLLALTGYLTGNSSYSSLAADLIMARFVRREPMFEKFDPTRDQHLKKREKQELNGPGYGFPPPLIGDWARVLSTGRGVVGVPSTLLFDAFTFDPTLLLDGIRLLAHPHAPKNDLALEQNQKIIKNVFAQQLAQLLYEPVALMHSVSPPSPEEGGHYDAKVAALAAFLDDARLFLRVANRARLRLPAEERELGLLHDSHAVRDTHWRLIQGCSNTQLVPFSLATDPMAQDMYEDMAWDHESPFHLLRLH